METKPEKKHTLLKINKSLCSFLAIILFVMTLSYYLTTMIQVELTKLSSATIKLNNENVELQNKLDNLMSYNNVEELVRQTGILEAAKTVIEIDNNKPIPDLSNQPPQKAKYKNYYRWTLGF